MQEAQKSRAVSEHSYSCQAEEVPMFYSKRKMEKLSAHKQAQLENGDTDLIASLEFIHYKLASFLPLYFLIVVTVTAVIITVSTKLTAQYRHSSD